MYFSDEPDWGMDQNLNLSWLQAFNGESQGYRHMYFPAWSFHVPLIFYPQGQTMERIEHFYNLSKVAFENGDPYWGFRFLARTLHYVQDMSQPYHTQQLYWKFLKLSSLYKGNVQVIRNYHFNYESYQANLFRLEDQGVMPARLKLAIKYSQPIEIKDSISLAKYIAQESLHDASNAKRTNMDFFDKKYMETSEVIMTKEEFFEDIKRTDDAAVAFHDDLMNKMELFGMATKSLLEFARRDLKLD